MKFDKESWFLIILCLGLAFAWQPLCVYMGWTKAPSAGSAETETPAAAAPAAVQTQPGAKAPLPKKAPGASPAVRKIAKLPPVTLKNAHLALTFDVNAGELSGITLLDYRNAARTGDVVIDRAGSRYGAFALCDPRAPWQLLGTPRVTHSGNGKLVLVRELAGVSGRFELTQEWTLADVGYATTLHCSLRNLEDAPRRFSGLVLVGGNLAPWHDVSGDKVRIPSHRLDFLTASGSYEDIAADKKDSSFFQNPPPRVAWAAVSNKYFCTILKAQSPYVLWQARNYRKAADADKEYPVISIGAALEEFTLGTGESRVFEFRCYSGPKVISDLNAFSPDTGRVMHLAWGPLDYLARALLWVLVQLHRLCGSYGWSIILLTVLVRLLFYPLTARSNASMNKMRVVQPKLKELREKYKSNPQLMNQKMMELYRQEGVNPFGGCLPILLQIPVFFALYATLDGAVELRQVPFWWCRDLAAADTVATINCYFFSLPVNPLVLAMTLLMVIQQQMTPMSMDPAQKKMMLFMPVVMLLFLYDLPSGLTLYWTVSNIFSIIQLRLQQKRGLLPAASTQSVAPGAKTKQGK